MARDVTALGVHYGLFSTWHHAWRHAAPGSVPFCVACHDSLHAMPLQTCCVADSPGDNWDCGESRLYPNRQVRVFDAGKEANNSGGGVAFSAVHYVRTPSAITYLRSTKVDPDRCGLFRSYGGRSATSVSVDRQSKRSRRPG